MFVSKEYIKKQVLNIIHNDTDNDIVFIVANKGIGKLKLLNELYDFESFNKNIIVANEKKVKGTYSSLKKCFIDGIYNYLKQNNTFKMRCEFLQIIYRYNNASQNRKTFIFNKKFNLNIITKMLYQFTIEVLKEIYIEISGNTPLVIFTNSILSCDDREYLDKLKYDTWEARITFVIGIRPSEDALAFIKSIITEKEKGVWVFPLLPKISVNEANTSPTKFASITINGYEKSLSYSKLKQVIFSNIELFETFSFIRSLIDDGLKPYHVFFLANQEITFFDYEYIKKISKLLYQESSKYEKQLILPYNGKLLWMDVLSYYLFLNEGIEEALFETQNFFFNVLSNIEKFVFNKNEKKDYYSFLQNTATSKNNTIAQGFSDYFSDFARVMKILSSQIIYNYFNLKSSLFAIELLDKYVLKFSETSIDALIKIYEYTQVCTLLDMGLKCIEYYFNASNKKLVISKSQEKTISNFQKFCLIEACRWSDLTLIDGIINLQKSILSSGYKILFEVKSISNSVNNTLIFEYLSNQLSENNIRIGDVIMPKNTIFLSYTHKNETIATLIDNSLQDYGYHVVRDTRDVSSWDNLKQFMQSIRKQDFVVLLVSDAYLHSENCMYEVMQLLKDESFASRTFPIVLNFPKSENKSMFSAEYGADIVLFWQKQAELLKEKIEKLSRENSAGLDLKYRDIKNIAQNSDVFLQTFFNNLLLEIYSPDQDDVTKIVESIDKKIQNTCIEI